jgi:hypothetical protein
MLTEKTIGANVKQFSQQEIIDLILKNSGSAYFTNIYSYFTTI